MDFRILGPLEVSSKGMEIPLGGPRQQNLLGALLLSAGQVVPFSHLVDVTWDHDPPPTAGKQVRNIASDLRGRLTDTSAAIVAVAAGYRLDVDVDNLDSLVFARMVEQARRDAAQGLRAEGIAGFRAALDLWRGPALVGLSSAALQPQLARLNEERLVAFEEWVDLALAEGQHRVVVSELAEWVAANPLRERLAAQVMLALYRSERQADALVVYEQTRRALADRLGIDPGAKLHDLRQRVLVKDPALSWHPQASEPQAPRCDLPRDISHFTGRADELYILVEPEPDWRDVLASTPVICAIDGMAGIGKTTLAVHAAHLLAERYPDGQLFIDLRAHTPGHTPLSPSAALYKLLRATGLPGEAIPTDLDERSALWRARLARRRSLLVLDNAADTAQVRPLLPGTPHSMTVVTSRTRLTDLDGVRVVSLDVLSPAESRELFVRGVGDQRPLDEPDELEAIVTMCGGLPLAIRIAAARLRHRRTWTVSHLVDRLRDRRQRLTELRSQNVSVAAVFAMSYHHLSVDAQRLFGLLGWAPGFDIDLYAASALANVDRYEVESQLEGLVDTHLLRQSTPGRYHFHDLLRAYAAQQDVASTDERRAALDRLVEYYLLATSKAMSAVAPQEHDQRPNLVLPDWPTPNLNGYDRGLSWLELEHHNLLALAARTKRDGLATRTCELSAMLWRYFHVCGRHDDALVLHELAISAARAIGDRSREAAALAFAGDNHWWTGRYEDAIAYQGAALALARQIGDLTIEARSQHGLGLSHWRLGRYGEANGHYQQALELARRTGLRTVEGYALHGLGGVHLQLGFYNKAIVNYDQAFALARRTGQSTIEGYALYGLGLANARLGRLELARALFDRALALGRDTRQRTVEGRALHGLGVLYVRTGQLDEAAEYLHRALVIAEDTHDRTVEGRALHGRGLLRARLGQLDEARDEFVRALDLARDTRDRTIETLALHGLAQTAQAAGQLASAVHHLRLAVMIAEETGDRYELARAHDTLADVLHELRQVQDGDRHRATAQRLYADLGVPESDLPRPAGLAD